MPRIPKKPTTAQIKKERAPAKLRAALKAKGLPAGKPPAGKVAHHVKAVAQGGKTTPKNIRVVSKPKHKQIHTNRAKKGQI